MKIIHLSGISKNVKTKQEATTPNQTSSKKMTLDNFNNTKNIRYSPHSFVCFVKTKDLLSFHLFTCRFEKFFNLQVIRYL
jgi:hypothetical protein